MNIRLSRRASLKLAGTALGALLIEAGAGRNAYAANKDTLVIGVDTSDTNSFDPGRQFGYSAPITMHATYETLVTMVAGDYVTIRPMLAESWERADDDAALVFHLRKGIKFASGNELTAVDVQFSFDRLRNLKDNPAELATNVASVTVIDPYTVKITLADKAQPLLNLLVGPSFVISDSKTILEHGGVSSADAEKADKATQWLDQHSAGTGPYVLTHWEPNTQIVLSRNDHYWREKAPFKRIVIQHIAESATQLLTLERGDIEAALNLTTAQLDRLEGSKDIDLVDGTSLDFVYVALTASKELSPELAVKEARQAIAYAIDYDGLIKGLEGGFATRPPSFIPNGLGGATSELTQEIGYRHDPDKARSLLAKAGLAKGFSFDLYYGDASVAGTTYQLIVQKLQSDLAAVGITANLHPLDQTTGRSKFRGAELPSFVTFWNPDGPEPWVWAAGTLERLARRVRWAPPPAMTQLVADAGAAHAPAEQNRYYRQYMEATIDNANYIVLFQPVYRVATRRSIKGWKLTAAGWQVDLYDVQPA
jgi:peptide/nickel transport system substrate-binding protein